MRETRVRAKRIEDGKWGYGFGVVNIQGHWGLFDCDVLGNIIRHIVAGNTVGQFTGLYDKNGKEIYERDVVKAEGLISIRVSPVIFKNGMFCIVGESALLPLNEYVEKGNELEVVGNACDNPELLEK